MASAPSMARFLDFLAVDEERDLLAAAPAQSIDTNGVVIQQGAPLRTIYVIEDGSVGIERVDDGALVPLAILGPGDIFGEMTFIAGGTTSARVVALEPTRVRLLHEHLVDDRAKADPTFPARLYRSIALILVDRLRRMSMSVTLENQTI